MNPGFPRAAVISALSLFLGTAAFGKNHPKPLPEPWTLIEKSLSGSPVPYRGKLTSTFTTSLSTKTSQTIVSFSPPDFYRREVLNSDGKIKGIAISNGKTEWVYNKNSDKYWAMPAQTPPDAKTEFQRLRDNYHARSLTFERAAGRRAIKIELRSKKNNALSRRLWLDPKYGVILQSQIFSANGHLFSETAFQKIRFFLKEPANPKWFLFHPPAKAIPAQNSLVQSLLKAKTQSQINPATPSWLPFGYALETIKPLSQKGQVIIQEEFSDGINAISLFEYPQSISLKENGERGEKTPLALGYGRIRQTSEGEVLDWSRGNLRFVLVAPLEKETLVRIADSVQ